MKFLSLVAASCCVALPTFAELLKVGVAKLDVTPNFPVVLAGYAGRPGEFTGQDTPLLARAIAIGSEQPVVLVAVDNCGASADFGDRIAAKLKMTHGIERDQFVVAFTHTHNAPNLKGYAEGLWGPNASEKQWDDMQRYTKFLEEKVYSAARQALENRVPASLEIAMGRAHFGGNRRLISNGRWAGFGFQQDGPVDHSVPTLIAKNAEGIPIALWTSYACHCTTPGGVNRLHWDWAGAAAHHIERTVPGATAVVTIGCGADVGPQPSGSAQHADDHGRELATEATRLLNQTNRVISTTPKAAREDFGLPLAPLPTRAQLEERAKGNPYIAFNARHNLKLLEKDGKLASSVPYSVTTWKFGDQLAMIFLNGEVCVDYAVRLKKELDWQRIWITGWANDVPGYIPSRRVLQEGGYEPDDSMNFYLKPTRFADEVEEILVTRIKDQVGSAFLPNTKTPQPDFLKLPAGDVMLNRYLKNRFANLSPAEKIALDKLKVLAEQSLEGYDRVLSNDGEDDVWFDSTGGSSSRPFIRQLKRDTALRWVPKGKPIAGERTTFVFRAGMGYLSEPKTGGFAILINGKQVIGFDITNQTATWTSEDGKTELFFLPTWNSDQDAAGLFYLTMPGHSETPTMEVKSLGQNSRRWFALEKTSSKEFETKVLELNANFSK